MTIKYGKLPEDFWEPPKPSIVERLRSLSAYKHDDLSIGDEAADEIESLREHCIHLEAKVSGYTGLKELLAECQAREAKLREALDYYAKAEEIYRMVGVNQLAEQALAVPQDDSALQEALKQARKEALLEAADELMNKDIDLGLWLQRKAEKQK